MKRYGYLFEKIHDIDNIKLAHKNARKGKAHYTEVKMVDDDLDKYCGMIQAMLEKKTFVNGEYDVFEKNDKGKIRVIYKLPYFPDRIIHHAIMQVLEPIWKRTLIADTFQSIKGRGVHRAKDRVHSAVMDPESRYCLKLDVQKFYPSIKNDVLKVVVRKKIKCKDTLWLLDTIIESIDGLPIGNYISQYLGNLALSELDHLMKEKYKINHYFRYCDDIVFIHKGKQHLHAVLSEVRSYLGSISLVVKKDYQVFDITKRGIDFVGFVFTKKYVRIRKSIKVSMFKALAATRDIQSAASYFGWMKAVEARGLWLDVITRATLSISDKNKLRSYQW